MALRRVTFHYQHYPSCENLLDRICQWVIEADTIGPSRGFLEIVLKTRKYASTYSIYARLMRTDGARPQDTARQRVKTKLHKLDPGGGS